ncbi:MAG TPA: asparagine synthase (glutamine-hydrolyzing) [Burkholderiales bacterium]|nr:asparagine synthase (glutamine-hydrolyzing) [Burkholderiales bacterium]
MCGIAGVLSFDERYRVEPSLIERMRDSMPHRGPDGVGAWTREDGRVGLGFRRLAIIDLSPEAMQPMPNEDGRYRLVFNGEIYNHAEIRAELERIGGHRWKTDHSDTEVILHAFEQWGIDCLERMRGMFSIGLWDARRRELWLIRDRIGVKPLYYSIHHGRITFASEIKALLQDPAQQRAVNEEALYHFLSFLTTPAPQTLFEGIRKLPAATWLRIDARGVLREHRYWDPLERVSPLVGVRDQDIAERVLSELRTAVALRKVSDVPVGVFLSGGIDSSTNTALFSEGHPGPVKTFSIGYRGKYASLENELHYAAAMARAAGSDHHEKLLELDDLIEFLPKMVWLQDEPIADPVCVPVYYLSQLARDNGVTVCQVGEGADELFFGYPAWQTAMRLQKLDGAPVPGLAKRAGLRLLRAAGKDLSFPYEWLRRGEAGQPVFWGGAEAFTETHKKRLLSERLRRRFTDFSSWEAVQPIRRRFEERAWEKTPLQWMTYMDLALRLPELLLMRVDKMTMGVGLEARVPFLDHRIVELAMAIPESAKARNGTLKHILKMAVRGVIPDAIIDRKKQGFAVPVTEWFLDRLGAQSRAELDRFCAQTDLLDRAEVSRLMDSGSAAQRWYLLNLALWWKTYVAA